MIRPIRIEAVLNGYTVNVGCQTLVFRTKTKLLSELGRYLSNPTEVEKEYVNEAVNAEHTLPATTVPRPLIYPHGCSTSGDINYPPAAYGCSTGGANCGSGTLSDQTCPR